MFTLLANNKKSLLAGLLSAPIYFYIAYFLNRSNFYELMGCFSICFIFYTWWCKNGKTDQVNLLIVLGMLFRLIFLFSIPSLSDDYFRFIWDGQLSLHGLNPFDLKPGDVVHNFPNKVDLLSGMNSPDYYTVYPPIAQFVYFISAALSPNSVYGSIIVMRSIILLAEFGTIVLLPKLLRQFHLNPTNSFWYILNPLVIVELSGNLHFEGIMIFFFLIAIYLLKLNRIRLAALPWAFAAATKLIPIFFLPVLLRKYNFKASAIFYLLFGLFFTVLWIPFYNADLIPHFLESIRLYSKTFEFNASIYYIVRFIGYKIVNYNTIQTAGLWLSGIAYAGILLLLLRKKINQWQHFLTALLFALSWYYFMALIIHPWYCIPVLFLAVFTSFRYPVVWSFLILFSYWAYSNPGFQENHFLIIIEYTIVITVFVYELTKVKQKSAHLGELKPDNS